MARTSYLICATPRSGSQLLCELLGGSGVAGTPDEYFQRDHFKTLMPRYGVATFGELLAAVVEHTATPNGVFGAKVMGGPYLEDFEQRLRGVVPDDDGPPLHALLTAAFGELRLVYLTRRNKLRQAVSLSIALQTNRWQSYVEPTTVLHEPPRFDYDSICYLMQRLALHESSWQRLFSQAAVTPLTLVYEDLAADPARTLRRVLSHLGVAPSDGAPPPPTPRCERQADARSEDWVARFLAQDRTATPPVVPEILAQGYTAQLAYEQRYIQGREGPHQRPTPAATRRRRLWLWLGRRLGCGPDD